MHTKHVFDREKIIEIIFEWLGILMSISLLYQFFSILRNKISCPWDFEFLRFYGIFTVVQELCERGRGDTRLPVRDV